MGRDLSKLRVGHRVRVDSCLDKGRISMKRYYAAVNDYATETSNGFYNTWSVYVFESKKARDSFVKNDYRRNTKAIKKDEVTRYSSNWSLTQNRYDKPRAFTNDYWGVDDYTEDSTEGHIGCVVVCRDGSLPRLFG